MILAPIDRPATTPGAAVTTLRIRMKRVLVVDSDLFAGSNVPQSKEQDVPVDGFHIGVRLAAVIDVMRAIAAAAAVQAPAIINRADAQFGSVRAALRFEIGNAFAGIFGNLAAAAKTNRREATVAVDW